MPMVEGSIVIDAPAAGLFALSQDYALRRAWDPFVRSMRFLDGAREAGKGVRVWVRAWTGLTMEVELTSFRPPASVAMRMRRGPWFLHEFAGTWLFKPLLAGGTEVTFRYSFAVRGRWLWPLLGPIIKWVFQHDVRARLRGLKRGAEQEGLLERLGEPCA
jgi:ribosome-associated toxin RatA of RatAB toxin-antitoxin module